MDIEKIASGAWRLGWSVPTRLARTVLSSTSTIEQRHKEVERLFHERTAFYLGSLLLYVLNKESRDEPCNIDANLVGIVAKQLKDETGVEFGDLDPHALTVVEYLLENNTPNSPDTA